MKGLESIIELAVVHYYLDSEGALVSCHILGWKFDKSAHRFDGCTRDPIYDFDRLKDLYKKADPNYSGRITVPVLWDKIHATIVSNESSDIIKMFNNEFNEFSEFRDLDLRPHDILDKIDKENEWIYDYLNNGVYKAGFATTQTECIS